MRSLLSLILNAFQIVYLVLCTSFWIGAALLVRLLTGETRAPLMMAHRYWSRTLLWAGHVRIEVRGLENIDLKHPYFFACNHQSMFDIPLLYRVLPVPLIFILKEELGRIPILGWYIRAMGMILVPRRERLRSVKNLEQCRQRLEDGLSILMFPEGTRSRDEQVLEFKSGVFVPALDLEAEVVPVAILGSSRIVPPGSLRFSSGIVRVAIGEPVSTRGLGRENRRELAKRVRDKILTLQASWKHPPPVRDGVGRKGEEA